MNRFALLVCAATLLLAGCVLPASDELTFVDSSGPARLDGTGDLSVFVAFTPNPDGPQSPSPPRSPAPGNPEYGCHRNWDIVAADGDAADGCDECSYTFRIDLHIAQPDGNCGQADGFPEEASHLPYAENGAFPEEFYSGFSIGVGATGAWWLDGENEWAEWIPGEPGANSFDGVVLDWRNTGTNSWVREEVNFSWTTAAEE